MSDSPHNIAGSSIRASRRVRRGSAYVTVLATAMIVTVIGLGSLFVVRAHSKALELQADAAEARNYAHSAIEVGLWYIQSGATWRSARPHGIWASNIALGSGTYTLEVTDPLDGELSNWPMDPILIKGTGRRGFARQMVQVTLDPNPQPSAVLGKAIHTAGQLRIRSGRTLRLGGAIASTNGSLHNEGTIQGSVEAASASQIGTVTGTTTIPASAKTMPASNLPDLYAARGTAISPGAAMERIVLGPGVNPYGAPDPDGLYVITSASDITIRDCRIVGTLVVLLSPGRKLTIENSVHFEPARSNYPVLLVRGQIFFKHAGDGAVLSEIEIGVNFNPTGAPYLGETDSDVDDTYPSEIVGLVHATDAIKLDSNGRVRGLIISGSSAASDAVDVSGDFEIIHDPDLFENPPIGYGTSDMIVRPGSWVRIVD